MIFCSGTVRNLPCESLSFHRRRLDAVCNTTFLCTGRRLISNGAPTLVGGVSSDVRDHNKTMAVFVAVRFFLILINNMVVCLDVERLRSISLQAAFSRR